MLQFTCGHVVPHATFTTSLQSYQGKRSPEAVVHGMAGRPSTEQTSKTTTMEYPMMNKIGFEVEGEVGADVKL